MAKYILKRLAISVFTIFVLITIVFFLVRMLPGDPFISDKVTPEIAKNMLKYYGLDKPMHEQFYVFLKNLVKGDLGYSLRYSGRTVNQIIIDSFPYSADLGIRALIFATIAGLLLGIIAALNMNKIWDQSSMFIAIVGISVPSFIIGAVLQYFFGVKLGWLPVAQWKGFTYTLMPSFALGLSTLALIARLMRASMLEVVNQDYIKAAKAKGLSPAQITWKYQIRNAILPIVTVLGPTVTYLTTGTFVVEQIFAIPGLGRHYVIAIQNLDYSLTLGLTIFFGSFLVLMNFFVDIAYGLVDPRIRL